MNSYKICANVFEEGEAVYMTHNYHSVSCFKILEGLLSGKYMYQVLTTIWTEKKNRTEHWQNQLWFEKKGMQWPGIDAIA